ncbi:bromodomain-containing protein 8 [Schistosoma japonicum]|nr:bromodomain-containing protein 8 [Schistosoma japonicum]
MNWAVGANCYLLRAVHTHGKNWDLVRESLKTSFKTFLKNENVEDLSNQSCSLQYKYIIACARQRNPGDLTESQLLNISLDHYTTLRREELHAARLEILRAIKIEEEDAEKLREARYSEIPADRILMYRTRCRSLGIPDRIGRCLNLEPLPPVSEENDRTVKNSLISPERQNIKTEKESVDENGGVWIPVKTSYIYELFKERPDDLQQSSLANFIRAQAVISQRLGFEGQDDEMSSLDTTSSVQTHSEITGTHNQEAKTELPESSEQLNNLHSPSNKTKVRTSPSKCLEILDEPNTPNSSALVSDSETLASPHFTQSLNSSPALSLVETQSPSLKAINCNRKRHTKKKISTAPVYQNHEAEFTSAFSPSLSTNLNNDELTDGSQSSTNVARRWRRSLLSALSTVYSHRHAYVFMHPVTEDIAPGYSTVVYEPVDLTSLRRPAVDLYDLSIFKVIVITFLQPLWSIMAEDIPGFPTLPVYSLAPTQITHSLQQLTGVSAALPISPTNPSSCVPKDEESCATRQPCGFIVKQNKRPAPEGTSPSSPLPRKHRHSSGNDSVVGSVMTRSK